MKLAVVGSRGLHIDRLGVHIAPDVTEIVSGGAIGIDQCAAAFARANGLKLTEFLPDYTHYGRGAPLYRNEQIVRYADEVLAFWDGRSTGTQHVIRLCEEWGKPYRVVLCV